MTGTQLFGLILGGLALAGLVFAYLTAEALLRDNRESRRHKFFVDEERSQEIAFQAEVEDLEVQAAMSGLDDELDDFLS